MIPVGGRDRKKFTLPPGSSRDALTSRILAASPPDVKKALLSSATEPLMGGGRGNGNGNGKKPKSKMDQLVGQFDELAAEHAELTAGMAPVNARFSEIVAQMIDEAGFSSVVKLLYHYWHTCYAEYMDKSGHKQAIQDIIVDLLRMQRFGKPGSEIRIFNPAFGTGMELEIFLKIVKNPEKYGVNTTDLPIITSIHANDLSDEMSDRGKPIIERQLAQLRKQRYHIEVNYTNHDMTTPDIFPANTAEVILVCQTLEAVNRSNMQGFAYNLDSVATADGRLIIIAEFPPGEPRVSTLVPSCVSALFRETNDRSFVKGLHDIGQFEMAVRALFSRELVNQGDVPKPVESDLVVPHTITGTTFTLTG